MSKTPRSPSVAVVVPRFRRELLPDEQLSLRHLEAFLGGHDRCFVAPASLRLHRPGFEVIPFPDECFESVQSYSRLLLSASFYRAFEPYRFMLIYQLDCLVFSDALSEWCEAGFDYVGAPWLADPAVPERGFSRVGNGGFSLRRIAGFLEVLGSTRYLEERVSFWRDLLRFPPDLERRRWLKRVRVLREARRGVGWYARHYTVNEDRFWSDRATLFSPGFRIAPAQAALGFSFERAPRYCYERNGKRLPFGCHAWNRWDRAFWEPHLLAESAT